MGSLISPVSQVKMGNLRGKLVYACYSVNLMTCNKLLQHSESGKECYILSMIAPLSMITSTIYLHSYVYALQCSIHAGSPILDQIPISLFTHTIRATPSIVMSAMSKSM